MDPINDFDDSSEINFDSPPPSATKPKETPVFKESRFSTEEARDAALTQELESIRKINQVIEGVVESLEKAKGNMEVCWAQTSVAEMSANTMQTVSQTVNSASTLLHTWTRILSQTEHNQRLILNPNWQGATQDMADIENDEHRRHQDAQRRQYEEQQRREAAARKAEEEERKRTAAPARGTRGSRGSRVGGRPASGAGSASSSGYGRVPGSTARGASRGGSSTGRPSSTVGRTRGTRGRGTSSTT
jgi:hypothetical protein